MPAPLKKVWQGELLCLEVTKEAQYASKGIALSLSAGQTSVYASQKYKVGKRTKSCLVHTIYVIGGGGNPGQKKSSQLIWRSGLIL